MSAYSAAACSGLPWLCSSTARFNLISIGRPESPESGCEPDTLVKPNDEMMTVASGSRGLA